MSGFNVLILIVPLNLRKKKQEQIFGMYTIFRYFFKPTSYYCYTSLFRHFYIPKMEVIPVHLEF